MLSEKSAELKWLHFIIAFIIIFFLTLPVYSVQDLPVKDSDEKIFLGSRCETLEDKSGNLNVYSIISGEYDNRFEQVKSTIPNYGFTKSVYWVRFNLTNVSLNEFPKVLEIAFPLLDKIQLYIFSNQNGHHDLLQHEISGRDFSFKNRTIEHRNFVFPFIMHPEEKLTFLLRIETDDGMIFPLSIWDPEYFTQRVQIEQFLFGIYYGIIMVMILYNLFIFIFTRDKNYLIYILYISFFGMFQLAMNGLAVQYLWPETPWWGIHANPFFIGMSALFGSYFSIKFLNMPVNIPRFNRIMQTLLVLSMVLVVSSLFVDYSITILAGQILPLAMVFTGIPAAVICLKKGNRSARFYLIAWTAFFIGVILSTLRVMGLLPHNFMTEYGMQIGSGLEMILLSLALADRINIMKKEKEDAQQEVITSQTIMVDSLNKSKTEIEEAHRLLSLSEEKYRLLIEGSSDIIFTLDENLDFINANYAIANELRLNPKMIQGLNFLELIYKDEREQHVSALLVKEKLDEFMKDKKPIVFRASFISPINTEPKEMQVHLEYINIAGKNEILGKASNVLDDSLLKYFESEKQKYSIGNYLITADEITHRITRNLKKYLDPANIKIMQIALREIIINAIEHGNLGVTFEDKSDSMMNDNYFNLIRSRQIEPQNLEKKVQIEYSINSERVIYIISDEGEGFDYQQFTTTSQQEVNENFLAHGRGITMTQSAFDDVTYNKKGNHVMLTKYLKKSPENYQQQ
ncbi:MAG TPA: 7TM diverse intracellular signaling domain-containing protein [Spirochaetota bacterium]|nr:7TM diverse intracellular signaling domain-containing protein [Spirochaetota bacterium]